MARIIRLVRIKHHQIGRRTRVHYPLYGHINTLRYRHIVIQWLRMCALVATILEFTARPHHATGMQVVQLVKRPNWRNLWIIMKKVVTVAQVTQFGIVQRVSGDTVRARIFAYEPKSILVQTIFC